MPVANLNSTMFIGDSFFAGDGNGMATVATIAGADYDCSFIDDLDPKRNGHLKSRPGHWATLFIGTADLTTKPTPQTDVTIDGVVWRVDSSSSRGDVWEILIVSDQRKSK